LPAIVLLFVFATAIARCTAAWRFGDDNSGPAQRSTLVGVDRSNGQTKWTFGTDGPGELAASNAVDGRLAVRSRGGDLIMIDARTGSRRWEANLDDTAASRPVIAHRLVMILTSDRVLHAYDARTGQRRWRVAHAVGGIRPRRRGPDLPSDFDVRDSFGIAAARGVVVALGRGETLVRAYDQASGKLRWTADFPSAAASTPVVAGELVLVQDRAASLHALDVRSGAVRWEFSGPANDDRHCDAAFRAFQRASKTPIPTSSGAVTTTTSLVPFDPRCGKFLFSGASGATDLPPSIDAGTVIVDFDEVNGVGVLDATTGTRRWRAGFSFVAPAPKVKAVIGMGPSGLSRRDAATGAARWRFAPYGRGEMLVTGDEVLLAVSGRILGIDLATGAPRWSRRFEGPQSTPLAVSGEIVVLSQ
jgi:FOG: WD40-like repeat